MCISARLWDGVLVFHPAIPKMFGRTQDILGRGLNRDDNLVQFPGSRFNPIIILHRMLDRR